MKGQVIGRIRYPGAFVYCKPVAPTADVIHEPVVIFEVVSASTSHTDRIVKLREYQATPSVQRYIILEQDSIATTVFARQGPDWTARALTEGDTLAVPEIGIELALADICRRRRAASGRCRRRDAPGLSRGSRAGRWPCHITLSH